MKPTTFLVDTENAQSRWVSTLDEMRQSDKLILFFTYNSPNISIEILAKILNKKKRVECIVSDTGPNALDFTLVTELGRRIEQDKGKRTGQAYVIVSNDKGYDAAVGHWSRQGIEICRQPLFEPKHAAKSVNFPIARECKDKEDGPDNGKELAPNSVEARMRQVYRRIMLRYPDVTDKDVDICNLYMIPSMARPTASQRVITLHENLVKHFSGNVTYADDVYKRVKTAVRYIAENGPFVSDQGHGAA